MSLKNIIAVMLCLWATSSFAQNIKGTIKSQTGEAIGFANISILNSSNGTVADKDGNFSLDLSKGTYELQVSAIGYANKVQKIEVTDQALTIDVTLSDNTQTLGESGNRQQARRRYCKGFHFYHFTFYEKN